MIVLDTHVLVWLDEGSPRLGTRARKAIDDANQAGGLHVSAITFWEIAMLVAHGRLRLEPDLEDWRADLLSAGLEEIPVTGTIGLRAAGLARMRGDPADRMIVATAIEAHATLLTADERILAWRGPGRRRDARR